MFEMFYMNYHVLHMSIYNVMHENAVLNGGLSCRSSGLWWHPSVSWEFAVSTSFKCNTCISLFFPLCWPRNQLRGAKTCETEMKKDDFCHIPLQFVFVD